MRRTTRGIAVAGAILVGLTSTAQADDGKVVLSPPRVVMALGESDPIQTWIEQDLSYFRCTSGMPPICWKVSTLTFYTHISLGYHRHPFVPARQSPTGGCRGERGTPKFTPCNAGTTARPAGITSGWRPAGRGVSPATTSPTDWSYACSSVSDTRPVSKAPAPTASSTGLASDACPPSNSVTSMSEGWVEMGERRVRFADAEGNIVHECDESCDHDGDDDDDAD